MNDNRTTSPNGTHERPVEWWVVAAWSSLALVLLAGIGGAVGLG